MHAPQPALDETEMVEQVCQLLRSGKNVISVTSFFYPPRRGADVEQKLQAACREGGTSLHGTGIHPSFMLERLAATLSGLLTDVRHIELTEVVDCAHMLAASPIAREIVGWGFEPARITPDTLGALDVYKRQHHRRRGPDRSGCSGAGGLAADTRSLQVGNRPNLPSGPRIV